MGSLPLVPPGTPFTLFTSYLQKSCWWTRKRVPERCLEAHLCYFLGIQGRQVGDGEHFQDIHTWNHLTVFVSSNTQISLTAVPKNIPQWIKSCSDWVISNSLKKCGNIEHFYCLFPSCIVTHVHVLGPLVSLHFYSGIPSGLRGLQHVDILRLNWYLQPRPATWAPDSYPIAYSTSQPGCVLIYLNLET